MHPILEALGYLIVVSAFGAVPVLLLLYGFWMYLARGVDEVNRTAWSQPTDLTGRDTSIEDVHLEKTA